MISIETMKYRTAEMIGEEFPLVFWRGKGRIVGSDDTSLSLLVRGIRVDLTWDRLSVTWKRLLSNHTLDSRRARRRRGRRRHREPLRVPAGRRRAMLDTDGLLVLKERPDTPVHQYADMSRPTVVGPVAAQDPRRLTARADG